ncbi:MAG: ATP-dependent Clp protease ATP-binding subunit, partial [Oscillospiraceae bacterium]|nr:ATP-dependent Clp protease ATP-binding subunit [Oscillospiraceae bacterium]
MQPTLCARCKKNVAVIFITKIENGASTNEGLCLKCARELKIKPVDDMMKKMGISDEDLEDISDEMIQAFGGAENLPELADGEDEEEDGKTATFPFLNRLFSGQDNAPAAPSGEENHRSRDGERKNDRESKKRKYLENYCISLTTKAASGKLDQLVGRQEEIERVIQILNRRQKNNPCLIGEPGVGKTAIAEGLAMKIHAGDVPYKLKDKEIWLLDLTSLVAGTQFRGQFESRMKGLVDEIKKL